ncbi:hypothetical protein NFI96_003504 [Prochilodus magdalenae]|nr:hypothetical protein NFI96_003504 [Prochilodus magdalenae]
MMELPVWCLPNYCEHDGECSQSWSSFHCDCSGTGYTGATCHNSIFEPSCEAHRLTGSASGFFSIDPDGSGPLKPTVVYCNMTEEKVWMVVGHNSSATVSVKGSSLPKPHVMKLNYSATLQQLSTLLHRAEHCQQEVLYRCRKSRLFNTWVPADGAVGVEVEGHQAFWTCDTKPFILVLTTVPPHTNSLGVSTKTKAGLVTEWLLPPDPTLGHVPNTRTVHEEGAQC